MKASNVNGIMVSKRSIEKVDFEKNSNNKEIPIIVIDRAKIFSVWADL